MPGPELRGLAFQNISGETVRVHDCICWRHLDGRPCQSSSDRSVAESTDVVIIPVIPAGHGSSKRARKAATAAGLTPCDSTSPNANTTHLHLSASDDAVAPRTDREALLAACTAAEVALAASGLRPTIDACPKQTPGAKYNAWENRGVAQRVEVGARELASGTFCLALHPRLVHLLPAAAQAAAQAVAQEAAAGLPQSLDAPPAAQPTGPASTTPSAPALPPASKPSQRLSALSLTALVAACTAVARQAAEDAIGHGIGATMAATAAATTSSRPAVSLQCRKLHLWPEQLAAWGDTEAAIASVLAELEAAAAAATVDDADGDITTSRTVDVDSTAAGVMDVDVAAAEAPACPEAAEGNAQGAAARGNGPAAARVAVVAARPCVSHLRHLLQLGRPCHCGRGHCSLQELQAEVERCCREGAAGQQVATWLAPPAPAPPPPPAVAAAAIAAAGGRGRRVERSGGGAGAGLAGDGEEMGGDEEVEAFTGRVVLLVGNIPPDVRAAVVQGELAAVFAPYGCQGVSLSRTRSGGSHGWARVTLAGPDAAAATAAAVKELDGKLRLGGSPLSVSHSCGRLDTIFPYLPYAVRAAMRVDSTAAYSATDQATADRMTDLLAGLAERLFTPPSPPIGVAATPASAPDATLSTSAGRQQHPADTGSPELLPLTVTDGTACCGGNALSFARRFARVVAVELDEDRAADLSHNAALVRAWAAFQHSRLKPTAASPAATGPPATAAAAASARLPTAVMGSVDVLCGDYTQLAGSLRQNIVFMDPPWGGPQYCKPPGGAAAEAAIKVGPGGPGSRGGGSSNPRSSGGSAGGADGTSLPYGDRAFALGDTPLSHLVSDLLVRGAAGMVAVKLPSRADAEIRALQARVQQLVAAGTGDGDGSESDGTCGGGGSDEEDGDLPAAQGTPAAAADPGAVRACGGGGSGGSRRLLAAEITLGRSALLVFLLLPYKYGGVDDAGSVPMHGEGAEGGNQGLQTCGGAGVEAVRAAGVADGPADRGGGQGRGPRGSQPGARFRAALREGCTKASLSYRVVYD